MNLELDILKKEIANLKKEMASIKEHIYAQDSRSYFKIQWTFEQPTTFDTDTWLLSFQKMLPCTFIGYTIDQQEDTHFQSSLFPDLKNYKIHLCIYLSTSSKHLPNELEKYFTTMNGHLQIDSYIKQEEFEEKCSREPLLKRIQ